MYFSWFRITNHVDQSIRGGRASGEERSRAAATAALYEPPHRINVCRHGALEDRP